MISRWPARGGPVVRDGTVYFAASIWPFMGTFIYALDAETGSVSGEFHSFAIGHLSADDETATTDESIFLIASPTKPLVACRVATIYRQQRSERRQRDARYPLAVTRTDACAGG